MAFPNPEEPGALDLALDDATRLGADLVLANDPDADRLAVAVPDPASGAWRRPDRRRARRPARRSRARRDRRRATGWWRPRSSPRRCCRRWPRRPASPTSRPSPASSGSREPPCDDPGHRFVFGYEEALGYAGRRRRLGQGRPVGRPRRSRAGGDAPRRGGLRWSAGLDDLACPFRGARDCAVVAAARRPDARRAEMAEIVGRWRSDPPAALAGLAVTERRRPLGRDRGAAADRRARDPPRAGRPRRAATERHRAETEGLLRGRHPARRHPRRLEAERRAPGELLGELETTSRRDVSRSATARRRAAPELRG